MSLPSAWPERRPCSSAYSMGKALLAVALCSGFAACALLLIASQVVTPFFNIPESTKDIAAAIIAFYALRAIPMQFNTTCVVGVLRGGGDTRAAMYIDIGPLWIWCLPATALLALVFHLPIILVLLPCLVEDAVKMIWGLLRFRSRTWVRNITRSTAA